MSLPSYALLRHATEFGLSIIRKTARPLQAHIRPAFYERVSELLRGIDLAPCAVMHAGQTARRNSRGPGGAAGLNHPGTTMVAST